MNEFLETEEAILKMLKTVFDPEIPVNIYDLGLIYGIDVKPDGVCDITMTPPESRQRGGHQRGEREHRL